MATVHQGVDIKKVAEQTSKRMTTLQKIKKIEEAWNVKSGLLCARMAVISNWLMWMEILSLFPYGAPVTSCVKSQTTLKEYVEKKLRELVLDSLIVEESK